LVGDEEHAEIIRIYVEEGLGINKIAEMLGRSSRTSLVHIQRHNKAIERSGFCPTCKRAKFKYETVSFEGNNNNLLIDPLLLF